MPYSYTTYNPTVSTTDFSYSSLDLLTDVPVKDQLKVYKNGQLVPYGAGASGWLVIAGDNIQLGTAVSTGTIKIARESDIVNKEVTFTNSSVLTAQDLNKNSDQLLFLCQELYDKAQDIAVTTAGSLADNSVTEAKLQKIGGSEAVTTSTIRDGAVIEAKIGAGAVTEAKIGSGAVTETKILDGSVTANKIGSNAVTTVKILDANVTPAKLSAGAPTWDGSGNVTVTNNLTVTNNAAVDGNLSFDSGFGSTAVAYGCRAWASFNSSPITTGSAYTRSGNTVTINRTSHGFANGTYMYITFAAGTGGTATAGYYQITVVNANSFTITDPASGNITNNPAATIQLVLRQSQNVQSINLVTTNEFRITMINPMPDVNYAVIGSAGDAADADRTLSLAEQDPRTVSAFSVKTSAATTLINLVVFR